MVMKLYALWYEELHSTEPEDRRLMGWQARVHGHLLKISALLAVSASWQRLGKEHPQISIGHMVLASRILAEIHPGLESLVTSAAASNFGGMKQKVLAAITRSRREGLTRGELLSSTHLRPRDLDEVMEALKDGREIAVRSGTAANPEARYRLSKYRK